MIRVDDTPIVPTAATVTAARDGWAAGSCDRILWANRQAPGPGPARAATQFKFKFTVPRRDSDSEARADSDAAVPGDRSHCKGLGSAAASEFRRRPASLPVSHARFKSIRRLGLAQ